MGDSRCYNRQTSKKVGKSPLEGVSNHTASSASINVDRKKFANSRISAWGSYSSLGFLHIGILYHHLDLTIFHRNITYVIHEWHIIPFSVGKYRLSRIPTYVAGSAESHCYGWCGHLMPTYYDQSVNDQTIAEPKLVLQSNIYHTKLAIKVLAVGKKIENRIIHAFLWSISID